MSLLYNNHKIINARISKSRGEYMISQNAKEYLKIALIGGVSFAFGYLVAHFFYELFFYNLPTRFFHTIFDFITTSIGLLPIVLYMRRTMKSIRLIFLIAVIYTSSYQIAFLFWPYFWAYVIAAYIPKIIGFYRYMEFLESGILRGYVMPTFLTFLWSITFGIFSSVLTWHRKKNILSKYI